MMVKRKSKCDQFTEGERETLLTEYQKSQDSAEHFDRTLWEAISIFLAASFILIGIVATESFKIPLLFLKFGFPSLGIFFTICLMIFTLDFRRYCSIKYKRCQEIENLLGMKQHKRANFQRQPKNIQTPFLGILLSGLVAFWSYILISNNLVMENWSHEETRALTAISSIVIFLFIYFVFMQLSQKLFSVKRVKTNGEIWKQELGPVKKQISKKKNKSPQKAAVGSLHR